MLRSGQLHLICSALALRGSVANGFVGGRPSTRLLDVLNEGAASSGELILLDLAMVVWNGRGKTTLREVLGTLDETNLVMVGELIVAIGSSASDSGRAADAWIAKYGEAARG